MFVIAVAKYWNSSLVWESVIHLFINIYFFRLPDLKQNWSTEVTKTFDFRK